MLISALLPPNLAKIPLENLEILDLGVVENYKIKPGNN